MRYGIFSDVHGNLEAFKAVLDFFRRQDIRQFVFLGDLVGYGPNPMECVKLAMSIRNLYTVLGNHDAAVIGKMPSKWFNDAAMEAIEFTRSKLTGDAIEFLNSFPTRNQRENFTMVHGSPSKPLQEYLISEMQFLNNKTSWDTPLCFVGHTHIPSHFYSDSNTFPKMDFMKKRPKFTITEEKVLINVGSVGQPRDGDSRSSCAIYDTNTRVFELFRIPYDIKVTQQKMRNAGMPELLIDRLAMGI